jgi:hypothetical protein
LDAGAAADTRPNMNRAARLEDPEDDDSTEEEGFLLAIPPALGGWLGRVPRRPGPGDEEDGDPVVPVAREGPARRHRRGIRDGAFDRETEGDVPTDGRAWAAAPHRLTAPRLLTEEDPRDPCPPGFRGELYPPQKTLLAAMRALERRPLLALEDGRIPAAWAAQVQTRCGRVSERFSFGKTVLALALVCAQPSPAALPELAPLATYALAGREATAANRASGAGDLAGAAFLPELTLRYARVLPLTVVAAAAAVISQWEANARRFTALRFFTIESVRSLREFAARYAAGGAAALDLLFVKAGRVTASFAVPGEPPPEGRAKNRSLFEALARVLDGVPVARLIVDDFDTLKLGADDCFVPALFTWLVSATRRQTAVKAALRPAATVESFLRANAGAAFPILGAALDDVLNRVFSLHCSPAYVDAHLSSTALGFRRIYVRGGQAAAILRDLEVPEEIVEMVHAEAVGSAARALGLEAPTVGDVVRRVVGAHLGELRRAVRALARVARARLVLGAAPAPPSDAGQGAGALGPGWPGWPADAAARAAAFRGILKDGTDEEAAAALQAAPPPGREVSAGLATLEAWAAEQKQKYGTTLARMRDNIREGHCQCCQLPFEEEEAEPAYVLAGCCQIIVCEPCITRKSGAAKAFIRRCPNCARDIALRTGLVRVGAELDLSAALDDAAIADAEPEPAPAPAPAVPPRAPAGDGPGGPLGAVDSPKVKALLQLLKGLPIDCIRDAAAPPHIEGLLCGQRDAPWPAGKRRKILVFAVAAETLAMLKLQLARFGVPNCVLCGTRAQKDEAVRRLREEVDVMLVATARDCGGLDLPFLSHVVFYHRVVDKNVEAQVAARGQRLGREHNLEVVTLLNEVEAAGL